MNAIQLYVFVNSESALLGYKLIIKTYYDKQIVESKMVNFSKVTINFFSIYTTYIYKMLDKYQKHTLNTSTYFKLCPYKMVM